MLPSGEKGIEIAGREGRGERGRMLVISVSVNIIVCLWNFGRTTRWPVTPDDKKLPQK